MVARARATTMNLEFQNWTYNFRVALDWSLFIAFMGFIAGAGTVAFLPFFATFMGFMATFGMVNIATETLDLTNS